MEKDFMYYLFNFIIPSVVTLGLVACFALVSYKVTKDKSEKAKMFPIILLWGALVAAEIWKISYLIETDGTFNPNRYPIVFCSMVMYSIPLFAFRENRFSKVAKLFTLLTSIVAVVLFFAVQWQYPFEGMNIHSYFYHGSMLAISVYMILIKAYTFEENDGFKLFLVLAGYVVMNTVLGLVVGDYISLFGPNSAYLGFLDGIFGFLPKNCLVIIVLYVLCVGSFKWIALGKKAKQQKGGNQ